MKSTPEITRASNPNEAFRVDVTTIYALSMPKYVYVQLYGGNGPMPEPLKIKADKIEKSDPWYVLKLGDQQVGQISTAAVAGWWIQEEGTKGPVF